MLAVYPCYCSCSWILLARLLASEMIPFVSGALNSCLFTWNHLLTKTKITHSNPHHIHTGVPISQCLACMSASPVAVGSNPQWSWVQILTSWVQILIEAGVFFFHVPGYQINPTINGNLEMFWEVKLANMILTTPPTEFRLANKNMGLAPYIHV